MSALGGSDSLLRRGNAKAFAAVAAGFAISISFMAVANVANNPFMDPNTGQSTNPACQVIQTAQINAVQERLKAITEGMSIDSRKYFDPNVGSSCLKIISAINLDLSKYIDPTGWTNVISSAADALINKLRQQVCNLASNKINDVIGRYNNVIGQINGFDLNSYLQGQFQGVLNQTQANAVLFINANAPATTTQTSGSGTSSSPPQSINQNTGSSGAAQTSNTSPPASKGSSSITPVPAVPAINP